MFYLDNTIYKPVIKLNLAQGITCQFHVHVVTVNPNQVKLLSLMNVHV